MTLCEHVHQSVNWTQLVALVTDQNKCHTQVILLFDSCAVFSSVQFSSSLYTKKYSHHNFTGQILHFNFLFTIDLMFYSLFLSKKCLYSILFSSIRTTSCYLASKVTSKSFGVVLLRQFAFTESLR